MLIEQVGELRVGTGEPLGPLQRVHLPPPFGQPVVDQYLDGQMAREGAGALTAQAQHERGRARLSRWTMRTVAVVGAGRQNRVHFPRDHLLERGDVELLLGGDGIRVRPGPLNVLGGPGLPALSPGAK